MIQIMNQQKYSDIDKINNMLENFIKRLQDYGFEVIEIRPEKTGDYDIDKTYIESLEQRELLAYNRVHKIATTTIKDVIWEKAIKSVIDDFHCINNLIKLKGIKYPERIKTFREDIYAIKDFLQDYFYPQLRELDNFECPKSIEEMDADELREYIKTHNIK